MNLNPLTYFKTPSAEEIAKEELEEAKRNLLAQQAAAEHAVKMVEYYQGVVARLETYVGRKVAVA